MTNHFTGRPQIDEVTWRRKKKKKKGTKTEKPDDAKGASDNK